MQVDYLIIGQGICGTFLSYYLSNAGKSFIVIDEQKFNSASKVASGLINPVTGRRVVTTWMANELLPFAMQAYTQIGKEVKASVVEEKEMLAFATTPEMVQAYEKRNEEFNSYINEFKGSITKLNCEINYPFNVTTVSPCYLINMSSLLSKWRENLLKRNQLIEEIFDEELLHISETFIQYIDKRAKKIIFCNGIQAAESKFWKNLPFVKNKGQALIADIPSLSKNYIYKFSNLTLLPWQNNEWWIGSSHEINFETEQPTEEYLRTTVKALKSILKIPFTVRRHVAALRPATVERRPFVGNHPQFNSVAILNGMGTKGCSLAPWFAKEITENLIQGKQINKEADVKRFTKVLSR